MLKRRGKKNGIIHNALPLIPSLLLSSQIVTLETHKAKCCQDKLQLETLLKREQDQVELLRARVADDDDDDEERKKIEEQMRAAEEAANVAIRAMQEQMERQTQMMKKLEEEKEQLNIELTKVKKNPRIFCPIFFSRFFETIFFFGGISKVFLG
jgi:chromosome segregation ATPase